MNSLSWLIYAINVLGNVSALLVIVVLGIFVVTIIQIGIYNENTYQKGAWQYPSIPQRATVAIVLCVIMSLIPSQNTMYAIAASEIGEKLVQNQQVNELSNDAYKALQSWIKKQAEPEKR